MIAARSDIIEIVADDGVRLAARLYRPEGSGPWPLLFAASPYRFDNDDIPETCTFLWRETGPIDWYVAQGYAYLHLDVRGSGRSGGDYGFFDRRERRDLYDAIEWAARQPWCTGKVGGIGHSYYATTQWCMASERPPHLACIAPYDGHCDLYRGWAYQGGIPSHFLTEWWCGNVRPINLHPLTPDAPPRDLARDLVRDVSLHPTNDDFWTERAFAEALDGCTIPLFSIGVWSKLDLHLAGNIEGWRRFAGPKRLMITGASHMSAAQADFESVDFHARHLLPFYDHYLKGVGTGFAQDPPVTFHLRGAGVEIDSATWPPPTQTLALHLSAQRSGGVTSLNDGSLHVEPALGDAETAYAYPNPHWSLGNIELTPRGPDPLSRNLSFATAPLEEPLDLCGHPELILFLSSSRTDTDVIVKLAEQFPADEGSVPRSVIVTKGWLRASHREIPTAPLVPGRIYALHVALMPTAYRFQAGSRIRLDISCADSPVTDAVFSHIYTPDKVGRDVLHHDVDHASRIILTHL